jgi:GTP-binding protein Era
VLRIHAEVMVTKENHRPIVIGRDGQVLKKIGMEARKEIENLCARKIYLDLKVVSKRNWQKNPAMMKDLGYVVPKA